MGKAGVVSSYFLVKDVMKNYSEYNGSEAFVRSAIDASVLGGTIGLTLLAAPVALGLLGITATTGFVVGSISFMVGLAIGSGLDKVGERVKNILY